MMQNLLVPMLRRELDARALSGQQWDHLIRQARKTDLLARLAEWIEREGGLDQVPPAPRAHLIAGRQLALAQQREVEREVVQIVATLAPLGIEPVLLKGVAYALSNQPSKAGRLFSDIDILVPRNQLSQAEHAFKLAGWITGHHHAYDQRYYREWMHELPPMKHIRRGTTLDVHHAILPLTARLRPDSDLLLARAVPVEGWPGVRVLCPVDMILHSMTHLLHNEEMTHGLRDLSDLDLMLRDQGLREGFWDELVARAQSLDLQRPLHDALEAAKRILGTPVPDAVMAQARAAAGPAALTAGLMRWVWERGLTAIHPTAQRWGTGLALALIYLRAHWVRMPPLLLVRHLAMKVWRSLFEEKVSRPV